jgi:hypothetical protein
MKTVQEPARQVPVYGEYEVAVLGGSPAGVAAAVAAARAGRRTLLIERYGFLGGMGTAAGVRNFCGLHANVHGEMHRVVQGVASDLLGRIDKLGGLNAPHLILGKILRRPMTPRPTRSLPTICSIITRSISSSTRSAPASSCMTIAASTRCESRPRPAARRAR